MKSNELPDIIFLQFHGDSECVDNIEEISIEDVTWSQDMIYPTDVEYVRNKSPWISVNEQLPETDGYFLVTDGEFFAVAYFFKCWGKFAKYKEYPHPLYDDGVVKLYMPIPSFDEILEANRDVLERIK